MLNEMRWLSIKHACLLCMSSVFGKRDPKRFEGFIGIKMWNGVKAEVKLLKDTLFIYQQNGDYFATTIFKKDWTTSVDRVSLQISMESTEDLLTRTVFIRAILETGIEDLRNTCNRENQKKYKENVDFWWNLMLQCQNSMTKYIEYCQAISDLDKNKTWDTCELAVYLIQNNATKDEAFKFCREFNAITLQQFMEIDRTDIFGDVTTTKFGMSIPIVKKNELDLLLLAMKAKVEAVNAVARMPVPAAARMLSPETRDRGQLLEQLRQLNAPRYSLGGFGIFGPPAWKRDVNKHAQCIADIARPMKVLFDLVKEADRLIRGLADLKAFFDESKRDFNNALEWYSEKGKTVEDGWMTFQVIHNRLTQAFSKITKHSNLNENDKEQLHSAITDCYPPLEAYIAYIRGFIPRK